MILQKLLMPAARSGDEQDMYFRTDGRFDGQTVFLSKGQTISFDTCFNSFSIEKWMKYTRLTNLQLRLALTGSFRVQLLQHALKGDAVATVPLLQCVSNPGSRIFTANLPCLPQAKGIYSFSLEALEDGCAWAGGEYVTDMPENELNPVDIAIDICTFRREAFVTRNIDLLTKKIIRNPASPLGRHLEIFISDNGKTLDIPSLESEFVHIFPNKNVGGAGGFTRGMIEILKYKEKRAFTHVLVMDDDVLIHPDALERTYRLLQLMKPEYAGKTISGAMMRLDHRFIQHENCAYWNGKYTESAHTFLDMRRIENVLRGEDESADPVNFNAWWYSCIPVSKISMDNLPLPLFIRFDDVEYGLRTGSDILSLNGICLWHEPFDAKYSSSMDYYHMRNSLIINTFHRPDINGFKAAAEMIHQVLSNLVRYRYGNIELIFRAVDDFLKGADYMLKLDAESLHKELMAKSEKFQPVETLSVPFDESVYRASCARFGMPLDKVLAGERVVQNARPALSSAEQLKRWIRRLTMNGLILPCKGTNIVSATMNANLEYFRKRAVLNCDPTGKYGFVSTRSLKKSFSILLRLPFRALRLYRGHRAACQEYSDRRGEFTSIEFWNRYLGL